MAHPLRRTVAHLSRAVGAFRSTPRSGLRILMYHAIGSEIPDATYGLSIPTDSFVDQMRWLREESGLALVSLDEGVHRLGSDTLTGAAVAVTFDDGYRDALDVVAPIMAKHRIPFTVFIVGGFLKRSPVAKLYLDVQSTRELAAVPGATIGAHGFTHRPLTRLDDASLDREMNDSAAELASILGVRPFAMSYPHGSLDSRVVRSASRAGFRCGGTSLWGINRPGVSLLRLRRTEITAPDSLSDFVGKVRGNYDWYQIRQRLYWPLPAA